MDRHSVWNYGFADDHFASNNSTFRTSSYKTTSRKNVPVVGQLREWSDAGARVEGELQDGEDELLQTVRRASSVSRKKSDQYANACTSGKASGGDPILYCR